MTNVNGNIISVLQRKALEKQYVWKINTKTKHSQLGLLYNAEHFAMRCGNVTNDQNFWYKHFKSIWG